MAMNGDGFIKGMWVTMRHFLNSYVDDFRYGFRKLSNSKGAKFEERQGTKADGIFTVQYPDEKLAQPERFRFVPFLVVEDYDHPERAGKDWCTSCGICAKVCPPQCIWIVRSEGPDGKPVPQPEAFFIDIDICMNCGFCAEFCPFDAIKMDHDYELASYDRTSNHVFDKAKLSKEFRYWKSIAPTRAVEEMKVRGGWDHKDEQKAARRGGSSRDAARASADAAAQAPADAEKDAKRDEVRARRAAAATPVAEAPQPVAEAAAAEAASTGAKPWTSSHEENEKRKAAALARKAARAAKRGE